MQYRYLVCLLSKILKANIIIIYFKICSSCLFWNFYPLKVYCKASPWGYRNLSGQLFLKDHFDVESRSQYFRYLQFLTTSNCFVLMLAPTDDWWLTTDLIQNTWRLKFLSCYKHHFIPFWAFIFGAKFTQNSTVWKITKFNSQSWIGNNWAISSTKQYPALSSLFFQFFFYIHIFTVLLAWQNLQKWLKLHTFFQKYRKKFI